MSATLEIHLDSEFELAGPRLTIHLRYSEAPDFDSDPSFRCRLDVTHGNLSLTYHCRWSVSRLQSFYNELRELQRNWAGEASLLDSLELLRVVLSVSKTYPNRCSARVQIVELPDREGFTFQGAGFGLRRDRLLGLNREIRSFLAQVPVDED
jgi:hypothetical protein